MATAPSGESLRSGFSAFADITGHGYGYPKFADQGSVGSLGIGVTLMLKDLFVVRAASAARGSGMSSALEVPGVRISKALVPVLLPGLGIVLAAPPSIGLRVDEMAIVSRIS